ncbi:MAG TPA: NAD(P)H-binding protein [Anaerolineales bacterium]|nr:NAD(P)H-binding protein [Anaerolineales bacterium]
MKIAVTGAFSYSGKYITKRLLERNEEIITLTNHPNRPDPFNGRVKAFPLNFSNEAELIQTLHGVDVLVNTYWIRFDKGSNTQPQAVKNTKILVDAATKAGVKRIVHISITNPSADSHLPYFWGKAANEKAVTDSGMSYAILRPTVLFGKEDILINNIAWLLRHLPVFGLPGNGSYKLSPVYVDDLAALAVETVYSTENYIWDAVGPDEYTFKEMVELIGESVGAKRLLVPMPPIVALWAAQFLSLFVNDIMLTPEEVDGLMANLLISKEAPRCKTSLRQWLHKHSVTTGKQYASELARHF